MNQPIPPTTGETELAQLLDAIAPVLQDGVFVFATMPAETLPDLPQSPIGSFHEAEGTTLILTLADAECLGLPTHPRWRMITLTVHSSLEAVGFLVAIIRPLANAGISTNVISGFYHDHLFVPVARAEEALAILMDVPNGLIR